MAAHLTVLSEADAFSFVPRNTQASVARPAIEPVPPGGQAILGTMDTSQPPPQVSSLTQLPMAINSNFTSTYSDVIQNNALTGTSSLIDNLYSNMNQCRKDAAIVQAVNDVHEMFRIADPVLFNSEPAVAARARLQESYRSSLDQMAQIQAPVRHLATVEFTFPEWSYQEAIQDWANRALQPNFKPIIEDGIAIDMRPNLGIDQGNLDREIVQGAILSKNTVSTKAEEGVLVYQETTLNCPKDKKVLDKSKTLQAFVDHSNSHGYTREQVRTWLKKFWAMDATASFQDFEDITDVTAIANRMMRMIFVPPQLDRSLELRSFTRPRLEDIKVTYNRFYSLLFSHFKNIVNEQERIVKTREYAGSFILDLCHPLIKQAILKNRQLNSFTANTAPSEESIYQDLHYINANESASSRLQPQADISLLGRAEGTFVSFQRTLTLKQAFPLDYGEQNNIECNQKRLQQHQIGRNPFDATNIQQLTQDLPLSFKKTREEPRSAISHQVVQSASNQSTSPHPSSGRRNLKDYARASSRNAKDAGHRSREGTLRWVSKDGSRRFSRSPGGAFRQYDKNHRNFTKMVSSDPVKPLSTEKSAQKTYLSDLTGKKADTPPPHVARPPSPFTSQATMSTQQSDWRYRQSPSPMRESNSRPEHMSRQRRYDYYNDQRKAMEQNLQSEAAKLPSDLKNFWDVNHCYECEMVGHSSQLCPFQVCPRCNQKGIHRSPQVCRVVALKLASILTRHKVPSTTRPNKSPRRSSGPFASAISANNLQIKPETAAPTTQEPENLLADHLADLVVGKLTSTPAKN